MKGNLRLLYLYLFSFVGLIIVVIGSVQIVNLGLKTFIFKDADRYEIAPMGYPKIEGQPQESAENQQARQNRDLARQRERELSNSIALIAVGLPLYLYHWKTIQKEVKKSDSV